MVCLARLMSTIYPGFVFRVFHLLLGRLPSKADEFYLPKATSLKAPDIRLSPVVCLQKQSLPRVGHTSDLSVRKLYVARAAWSISWKCKSLSSQFTPASYMDILINRTLYMSCQAGPGFESRTVRSEGERSPH